MKKFLKMALIVVIAVLILVSISIFIILPLYIFITNNNIANNTKKTLENTKLPEKTELIDSISIARKVSGNGNGMQYFGAILIKSDLLENELNDYYKQYRKNDWSFLIAKQNSEVITVIDNQSYNFKKYNSNDRDKYYIIYSYGSADGMLLKDLLVESDLRGH